MVKKNHDMLETENSFWGAWLRLYEIRDVEVVQVQGMALAMILICKMDEKVGNYC